MPNPDSRLSSELHADVAIIGAGTAGLAAYRAAKAAGKRALLIESGPSAACRASC
jgi:flavin-dependent dehydrogenase